MAEAYTTDYGPNYGIATVESQNAPGNIYGHGSTTEKQTGMPEAMSAEEAAKRAPPPKYEEIFGKIATRVKPSTGVKIRGPKATTKQEKDAKRNECLKGLFYIGLFALSIAGLATGGRYIHDCPYNMNIPLSVILLASGYVLFYMFGACTDGCKDKGKVNQANQVKKEEGCVPIIFMILIMYMFAVNIFGCVQSFPAVNDSKRNSTHTESKKFCDDRIAYFAAAGHGVVLVIHALIILSCICQDNKKKK